MSNEVVDPTARLAEETAVHVVWAQWSSLTGGVVDTEQGRPWTIVDPEALVLASLGLSPPERRLEDLVAAWAFAAGFLMSKPRLKSVASLFPDGKTRLAEFARYAAEAGNGRWNNVASPPRLDGPTPRRKPIEPLRLLDGPALILRLRAGFGVSAKADLMAVLLGSGGTAVNLKLIATATGYTERTIRTATEEMVLAGLIQEIEGRPSAFYVDPEPWAHLLQVQRPEDPSGEPSMPPWQFWAAIFAFLASVSNWAAEARQHDWTDYVASSKARDLYDEHERRLKQAGLGLVLPSPERAQGTKYLELFHETVGQVCDWAREKL